MNLTVVDFFFNIPIYTPIEINNENWNIFINILRSDSPIEGYNPIRGIDSTFENISEIFRYGDSYIKSGGFNVLKLRCKRRNDVFEYNILWNPEQKLLLKVGQYPSVADFHKSEIKHYKDVLTDEKQREFTRAMGLAANGVGIGSYIYLRRIFEFLINSAEELAIKDKVMSHNNFIKLRMEEKIETLTNYLPSFLVENKSLYSILSLGIHELNENDCLAHFDTLRVGIEIILDEKVELIKKLEKIKQATIKLSQLKGVIKKPN